MFSMGEYLNRRYRQTERALAFAATNREEWEVWNRQLSETLNTLMGPWPERCPLDPQIVDRVEEEGYLREKVIFRSEPDMAVPAWVLIPGDIKPAERRPAVLALHGHGHGKDSLIGIAHGESGRVGNIRSHNYDYARQAAMHGYVVIAPDARGFGERRVGYEHPGKDGCDLVLLKAIMLGMNPLSLNVWDARRCIDYLVTRPEVDPDRIACIGLSYGGTLTLFTTIFEPRIKACVISGYLNLWGAFAYELGNFCGSQIVPDLLRYAEMGDVAALIAPRPALYECGKQDGTFPIAAAREAYATVLRAYEVLGVPDHVELDAFDGGHEWSGRKAWGWLSQWV